MSDRTGTDRLAEKPPFSDRELERLGELVANGCFDEEYKGVKRLYEAVMYERALVEQLQGQLGNGRAVLTDRIAERKAEQARWQDLPTTAMDRQDWVAAEHQQERLGEVEDLLEQFDATTARALGLGEEGTDDR